MMQTVERLEMPAKMYQELEQIAKLQGKTALQVVENWLMQYRQEQQSASLHEEYQVLITKDLHRILTEQESERLDAVCEQLNAIEMQTKAGVVPTSFAEIDAELLELQRVIESFPERKARADDRDLYAKHS